MYLLNVLSIFFSGINDYGIIAPIAFPSSVLFDSKSVVYTLNQSLFFGQCWLYFLLWGGAAASP